MPSKLTSESSQFGPIIACSSYFIVPYHSNFFFISRLSARSSDRRLSLQPSLDLFSPLANISLKHNENAGEKGYFLH
jgi:hypothetical protein